MTRLRQKQILETFLNDLDRLIDGPQDDVSLFAEDLRVALRTLGRLVGRVDVEDVLDAIFREFCIGK